MAKLLCFILNVVIICAVKVDGSLKLKMANVLYRHGDRSPEHTFPNDEHRDYWKEGLGQLTKTGMRQEFKMGKFLKSRYVRELIGKKYLRKQVYCRSSNKDRTLMSAEAQMAGLFPPRYKKPLPKNRRWQFWQLVPIHTVETQYDNLLRPIGQNCPRYDELTDESHKDPRWLAVERASEAFRYNISLAVGLTEAIPLDEIYEIYDMFFCQRAHHLSWPKWLTTDVWSKLEWLQRFTFNWLFNTQAKSRLAAGALVDQMIKNMKNFVAKPRNSQKLFVYSAHDVTISALLNNLDLWNRIPSPYSTVFMMELYKNDRTKEYTVQMFYRNDTSQPPYRLRYSGCGARGCNLDRFERLTAPGIPEDHAAECGLKTCEGPSLNGTCKDIGRLVKFCKTRKRSFVRSSQPVNEIEEQLLW